MILVHLLYFVFVVVLKHTVSRKVRRVTKCNKAIFSTPRQTKKAAHQSIKS